MAEEAKAREGQKIYEGGNHGVIGASVVLVD